MRDFATRAARRPTLFYFSGCFAASQTLVMPRRAFITFFNNTVEKRSQLARFLASPCFPASTRHDAFFTQSCSERGWFLRPNWWAIRHQHAYLILLWCRFAPAYFILMPAVIFQDRDAEESRDYWLYRCDTRRRYAFLRWFTLILDGWELRLCTRRIFARLYFTPNAIAYYRYARVSLRVWWC